MLLTIDIGTSNFKSALYDLEGGRLFFKSSPLTVSGNVEQWLNAFEDCLEKISNKENVKAIIITGNGPTLVPVLKDGSAKEAFLWLDRSAQKYQEEVSFVQGGYVDASFFLPKILKIKNEDPLLYAKVKHFLGCPEYLGFTLTGQAKSVFPSDGFDRWFWDNSTLEKLKLDKDKLPPFIRPGETFGMLSKQAALRYGLTENIPVISAGPDFFAAILGAGIIYPGTALDRTGSSEGINFCTVNKIQHERLMSYGHPIKPYWNLSGKINMSGLAVQQASEMLGFSDISDFFLSAQGSSSKQEKEAAASVLIELCKACKNIITTMEKACVLCGDNTKLEQLRVTGGLAGSAYLNQMKADITGKKIIEPDCKEAELLGCAIIGSCFMGRFLSFVQAASVMVKIKKIYEPAVEGK